MSRSLTSTLRSAINASVRTPAITLTAQDHIQHFTTYQSPAGTDGYHDACTASDGSIIRVRVTRGGGSFAQNFQFQRITTPATAGQWTTWTTFTGGSANCFQDGNCAVSNNSGTLRAFVQQGTGGNALWVWSSTNNGASWTGPVTIASIAGGALIKGIASAGNNDVFIWYDVLGGEAIGVYLFTAGAWGAIHTWPFSPSNYQQAFGLAVTYHSADSLYYIVASDAFTLYEATYNSGTTTWTLLPPIAPAAATSIQRYSPRLSFDSVSGLYTLMCSEIDSGLITGTVYNYPRLRQSADLLHWSAGNIFHDIAGLYGANFIPVSALGALTGNVLITMPTIQFAANYNQATSTQYQDLSAAILSYKRVDHINKPNTLELVLDNNKGALSAIVGTKTSFQPINGNTTLVLSEGYKTGSPPTTIETDTTGRYRIEKIQFLRTPQENYLKIIAQDTTRSLDQVNRFQNTYTNQTISYLIKEVCARAGLFTPTLPGTAQMSNIVATFVIQSGQTFRKSLDALAETYRLDYYTNESETIVFVEKNSGDASQWTYQNEITGATWGYDDWHGNHVIVTGKPPSGGATPVGALTTGEAYDDTDSHYVGMERIIHHVDQKLTTTAECTSKASFIIGQEQRAYQEWSVSVPANPALQVLDVVTVNDSAVPTGSGQSGTARIIGNTVTFHPATATFEMTINLEGV